ncbi:MAG: cyclic nucleotide-binding domain-containing protein [Curvibacter sp.]
MDSYNPLAHNAAIDGLITAISRNTDDSALAKHLGAPSWYIVADYLHPQTHERGHVLISQGAQDRKLYFLESGHLKVDVKTDKGLVQLAILGAGTVVGEGSFFSHLPRNASVVAYSPCKLWSMSPEDFEALSKKHPTVALSLALALGAIVATRMVDVSRRIAST